MVEATRDIVAMLKRLDLKEETERVLAELVAERDGVDSDKHVAALVDRAETLHNMDKPDLAIRIIQ
eukprot:1196294-Prorocentrum_minimum.AAC.2